MTDDADQDAARRFHHASEIFQTHLRAHPQHHRLDNDEHEPFVPQIDLAPLEKCVRKDHRRGNCRDDPGGELVTPQRWNKSQSNRQRDSQDNGADLEEGCHG